MSSEDSTTQIELERHQRLLFTFAESASLLLHIENEKKLAQSFCATIVKDERFNLAYVGIQEVVSGPIINIGAFGDIHLYDRDLEKICPENLFSTELINHCVQTGKNVLLNDQDDGTKRVYGFDLGESLGINSLAAIPLRDESQIVIGALCIFSNSNESFGEAEILLFESMSKQISFALTALFKRRELELESQAKIRAQDLLTNALKATVEAMTKTMEWRDPYTAGHQRRVANISVAIATQLGWDSDRVQGIYMAGLVHDLGKVGIPAEILTKPSQLNAIEMSLVQTHAEAGYQILKDIPFPWPLAEAVRQHHERLDGSGYPRQLHGTEICPEARLLAIADMIEAMASHRPYRPSLGLKRARDQIIEDAGSKLDSEMVSAALLIMAEDGKMESLLAS
jgi:hypothetical protein